MHTPFGVWVAAGVVVGALGATALVATGWLAHDAGSPDEPAGEVDAAEAVRERRAAVRAYLEAYERSRSGTYVVTYTFDRTLAGGRRFTADRSVAQRPPDRLERSGGSVTARSADQVVLCRPAERVYRCQAGPAPRSYEAVVEAEMAALRTQVEGPAPLYSVVADGDCFDLAQVRPLPSPPYGTAARFCFDPETGAMTSIRIERDEAVDVTEATEVRATVRPRDLRPPESGDRLPASEADHDGG